LFYPSSLIFRHLGQKLYSPVLECRSHRHNRSSVHRPSLPRIASFFHTSVLFPDYTCRIIVRSGRWWLDDSSRLAALRIKYPRQLNKLQIAEIRIAEIPVFWGNIIPRENSPKFYCNTRNKEIQLQRSLICSPSDDEVSQIK